MISIIITSFKDPGIKKAIDSVISQNIKVPYELIIAAPDKETKSLVKSYSKKNKKIKYFKDPGKGKALAINLLLKKLKGSILVWTDGDVYLDENAINNILNKFEDKSVGCVAGHPISTNYRSTLLGYWSHLLYDIGAHLISRKTRYEKGLFIECSGYLFAFRNKIIKSIPLDVAEDSIVPYYFWKKGYKIAYAENSLVYVKNPTNLKDFIKQRVRTAKAHETLTKYAPDFPRVKSFGSELLNGLRNLMLILSYAKSPKEFLYTLLLFPIRLYIWFKVYFEHSFKKKQYKDAWERVESTKI